MICPNCKKDIADDSIFCSGCGFKIGEQLPETKNRKAKKINVRGIAVVIAIALIAAGGGGIAYMNATPEAKYNKAEKAFRNRDYKKAVKYYTAAGDYHDAGEKLEQAQTACHYEDSVNLMEQGDYENAALALKAANGFEDANDKILEIGRRFVEAEDYSTAVTIFNYSENWTEDPYAQYANGIVYQNEGKYWESAECFDKAGDILDAPDRFLETEYQYANEKLESREYSDAKTVFKKISRYLDADEMANACVLMLAREDMLAGKLNTAKTALESLPADCSYKGYKVSTMLEKLDARRQWLAICGRWSSTFGEAESSCRARNYNYDGGTWTSEFNNGDFILDIKCVPEGSDAVKVIGTGTIAVFKNWSTVQMGLDYDMNYPINFNRLVIGSKSDVSIYIDDYTTITLGADKITLKYRYDDNNSTASFVYTYTTDITYGKRIAVY